MTEPDRPDRDSESGDRPLQRGDRVGPYRIEGPLGRGGMGEVVVAYDQRLNRRVAIKRIRHDASKDSDITTADRERLRREARAAAGLSHPAIVQIHDILTEGDDDAIVMELVEGRSVAERLGDGPLPLPEALRIARQVAEGLAEAHRVGLVHRDLKAENVMVTPPSGDHPGRAKILDFGLAKILRQPEGATLSGSDIDASLTQKGTVLGTVRAMSPEQAEGAEIDHRSDLFSFGVLLYEMLTGRSPFRGANAVETFRRLLIETPRPIRELRPAVPAELESLIARLLEKQPERRPNDAGTVARALKDLADRMPGRTAPALANIDSDSFSDVPTGSFMAADSPAPTVGMPPRTSSKERAMAPISTRRRWLAAVAGLVLLAVLAGIFLRGGNVRSEPLRVVVLRPEISTPEPAEDVKFIASGVLVASLATLADLEGIAPVEPGEIADNPGSAIDIARSVAADEILSATIVPQGGNVQITLRRVRGADGEVRRINTFDVSRRPSGARLVAEAVTVQLQRAYPKRSLHPNAARREISDADYANFVKIIQRIHSGEVAWELELKRLEAISERAPAFIAVHLRGAATAWTLHSDTRDIDFLERGEQLLARARDLAPLDPWVLFWTFRIALDRDQREIAEDALSKLIEASPNNVSIPLCHASLAERDGDLGAAVAAMRLVVERVPSWQNLHRLVELEVRRGDVNDARRHLEQLIARVPANTWGLAKLARLELFYGELERAVELYQQIIDLKPHRSYFTNLGLAHFLRGQYQEAKANYLEALAIQPEHLVVRLNLADTELALGEEGEARARYRRILKELETQELDAAGSMRMAQCLARLGEGQRAVAVTLEALQQHSEDAQVAYSAALVYALAGEAYSALANVEKALSKGVQPRWFMIPGFDALASDPRFISSLGTFPK